MWFAWFQSAARAADSAQTVPAPPPAQIVQQTFYANAVETVLNFFEHVSSGGLKFMAASMMILAAVLLIAIGAGMKLCLYFANFMLLLMNLLSSLHRLSRQDAVRAFQEDARAVPEDSRAGLSMF